MTEARQVTIPLLCRTPTCPSCRHELDNDEMNGQVTDLWALAPDEGRTHIVCPGCHITYYCQGGYVPTYTTALDEDAL